MCFSSFYFEKTSKRHLLSFKWKFLNDFRALMWRVSSMLRLYANIEYASVKGARWAFVEGDGGAVLVKRSVVLSFVIKNLYFFLLTFGVWGKSRSLILLIA